MNSSGPTATHSYSHSSTHYPIGMGSFSSMGNGLVDSTQEHTRNTPNIRSNTFTSTKTGMNNGNKTGATSNRTSSIPSKNASASNNRGNISDKSGQISMEDRIAMVNQLLASNDLYQILGLKPTCSQSDIRRSYILRSRIIHPDKMRNSESSTQAFQKLSSAYETLSDPIRRRDYDTCGRRYHSQNSEETLASALSQIFSEFMAGDFEHLLQIVEFLNTQNPELDINRETAKHFFDQVRGTVVVTSQYMSVAKFEVMRLYEIRQELRSLSYFDVLNRLRLTIQMTRVLLSIPVKMNTHVADRQIVNEHLTNVLGGVAGFMENSENSISDLNGWLKSRVWFG